MKNHVKAEKARKAREGRKCVFCGTLISDRRIKSAKYCTEECRMKKKATTSYKKSNKQAVHFYRQAMGPQYKKQMPDVGFMVRRNAIDKSWKKLTAEQKAPYVAMEKKAKKRKWKDGGGAGAGAQKRKPGKKQRRAGTPKTPKKKAKKRKRKNGGGAGAGAQQKRKRKKGGGAGAGAQQKRKPKKGGGAGAGAQQKRKRKKGGGAGAGAQQGTRKKRGKKKKANDEPRLTLRDRFIVDQKAVGEFTLRKPAAKESQRVNILCDTQGEPFALNSSRRRPFEFDLRTF